MSILHDAARAYAQRGWHVFPLLNKHQPLTPRGFYDASVDAAQIDAWWSQWPDALIGWWPGPSGHCVVDLDDKNGKHGSGEWHTLCRINHEYTLPRMNSTPSGGKHLIFRGSLRQSQSALANGIDTRGETGYVILPPSPGYHVENSAEPAEIPAWVSEHLAATSHERGNRQPIDFEEDNEAAMIMARWHIAQRLERVGTPTEGHDSDDETFKAAQDCKDDGLSPQTALSLLSEEWAPHFDVDWIRAKVDSAYKERSSNRNEPGCNLANNGLRRAAGLDNINDFEMPGAEPRKLKYPLRTASEGRNRPPPTYWDKHRGNHCIFPRQKRGLTILVQGEKAAHKTGTVLSECLLAIEYSTEDDPAKVLYIALEGCNGFETQRVPAALAARGWGDDDIADSWRVLDISPNLTALSQVNDLIADLKDQRFEPNIIVIDVLTRALGGININSPEAGMLIAQGADHLAAAFDASVLLITHPGKDGSRGALGSSLQTSLGYAIWRIEKIDDDKARLWLDFCKDGPAEFSTDYDITMIPAPVLTEAAEQPREQAKKAKAKAKLDSGLGLLAQVRAVLDQNQGQTFSHDEMVAILQRPYDDGSDAAALKRALVNAAAPGRQPAFKALGAKMLADDRGGKPDWRWGAKLAL